MRGVLAWEGIVRDTERLDLTQSDSALAKAKLAEAKETLRARLREAWCYLLYPAQDRPGAGITWISGKVAARDGLLGRASKRLVDEEALMPELGPERLDRVLRKFIWGDRPHLSLKDLWDYANRHVYLPRLKSRSVLVRTVETAVGNVLPGPFAYAEGWDEGAGTYRGLVIENAANAQIVIDSESVIVRPEVAEANRPAPPPPAPSVSDRPYPIPERSHPSKDIRDTDDSKPPVPPDEEAKPTRFVGTVMIPADRPVREIHRIVEGVVEQLTTLPGSEVSLKLEIDADVPAGLDRAKVRTLIENANTLGFIEKSLK